ncbi:MAG: papain-like cysteine peptidase [Rhodovarius sp.]|nr:papain-like cysteine peptidase [Rhodovarius sp.]
MSTAPAEEAVAVRPGRLSLREMLGLASGLAREASAGPSPAAPEQGGHLSLREMLGLRQEAPPPALPPAGGPAAGDLRRVLEEIVRGFNRGFFGHEPPPEVIAAQTQVAIDIHREHGFEGVAFGLVDTFRRAAGVQAPAPAPTGQPVAGGGDYALFAALVNACYRAMLGREAGEETIQRWWQEKRESFAVQGVEAFLVDFAGLVLGSSEWHYKHRLGKLAIVRSELMPAPRGVEGIAVHISLGVNGFTSAMFQRFGRKRWSGPFDWLSATPAIIRAIIADDFKSLLDPAAYVQIPLEERPDTRFFRCRHLGYEERFGHPCVLHAADMTDPEGRAYMERCVARFRRSMQGLASKLLLQVAPETSDPGREFRQTLEVLERAGRNYTFVMVSLLPAAATGPFPEVEPLLRHGPHRLLRIRTLGPIHGTDAAELLDEVILLRAVLAAPLMEK